MLKEYNLKHAIPFGWHLSSQRMVNVTEVANGRACECVCVACGVRLQARQGPVRVWHFAHDEETVCRHAAEAAIHRMAKQLIVERGSVFVPHWQRERTVCGERNVWSEKISVEVQSAGLQLLHSCEEEKTIGSGQSEEGTRRPDVFALLDAQPLAIEIKNTHAVDLEKRQWLEKQGFSVLEIEVADIAELQPNQMLNALEARLFEASDQSKWLFHAKDHEGKLALDELESQIRAARSEEERALLAQLDAEEAERKRREEARQRYRDIEDFKIGLGRCTVRIGRNEQRVSLKIHGFAPDLVFEGIKLLGRKHQGHFNDRARCWEFYRHAENKSFFEQLCDEAQKECLERYWGDASTSSKPSQVMPVPTPAVVLVERPLPIYFADPGLQEAFDERAAIREFEAGLDREDAERLALAEITELSLKSD